MNDNAQNSSTLSAMLTGVSAVQHQPPPGAIYRHSMDKPKAPLRSALTVNAVGQGTSAQKARDFTAADKALILRVHGYMNQFQLLGILNTRLTSDAGDNVVLYTIDQLRTEIASVSSAVPADGNDWGSLRKMLAKARRAGVLDTITEQVINDFAVVFSLNQKQVLTLKDIVLQREEEES